MNNWSLNSCSFGQRVPPEAAHGNINCMSAQHPPANFPPPPAHGPPGYGEPVRAGTGSKAALFMILGLVVGLVAGGLITWQIFSGGGKTVSAEYDVEVLCNYTADLPTNSEKQDISPGEPNLWRLQATAALAIAAERADTSYDELGELGNQLFSAVNRVDLELKNESVNAIQEFCNARD